jgi:hypothetical protein
MLLPYAVVPSLERLPCSEGMCGGGAGKADLGKRYSHPRQRETSHSATAILQQLFLGIARLQG